MPIREQTKLFTRMNKRCFLAENPDEPVSIRKTEVDGGELYRSIRFGSQEQRLPKPFLFTIDAQRKENTSGDDGRLLVLYDNAGEHFLPGSDKTGAPVTEHLAKSAAIFFVYDVTQDPRLRQLCLKDDPQIQHGLLASKGAIATRQETILSEAASRVRKHLGISTKKNFTIGPLSSFLEKQMRGFTIFLKSICKPNPLYLLKMGSQKNLTLIKFKKHRKSVSNG